MAIEAVLVRAVFSYLVLLALLRVSHKRAVAEATPFDFVLTLVLGDTIDDVVLGEVGPARFVAAVGTLTLCHLAAAVATWRSQWLHDLVESRPTVLLREGATNPAGLRAELVSEDDLAALLRLRGISREQWGALGTVRLEPSGELSVIRRPR